MSGVTVEIKSADLTKAIRQLERAKDKRVEKVRSVIFTSTLNIESQAKRLVPKITGRLQTSIHSRWSGDRLSGNVSTNVEYASAIEFGTKPYTILPNGKYLVFKAGGKTVFTTKVDHPGIRAQPYMKPAADMETPKYIGRLRQVLK